MTRVPRSRAMVAVYLVLAAVTSWSCAPARFREQAIVWHVDDTRDIPEPDESHYVRALHFGNVFVFNPIERALSLPDEEEAHDLNALDELPSSTWFENRIGMFELTAADVARGPGGKPPVLPFVLTKGKGEGRQPGFIAEDQTGRTFLVKFDPLGQEEMQTSAAAIVSRMFWTLGYHVPTEHVVEIEREIAIAPDATYPTLDGNEVVTRPWVEGLFELAVGRNGRYRVLASEFLDGVPKGGFPDRGRRLDDPNDRVSHEHRRSLRALRVFCAWLSHTDFNPQNTLDMYVEEGGRSFLRHYLVDFGQSLGVHNLNSDWSGHAYMFDAAYQFGSLFSFGLWVRPWENKGEAPLLGVGRYFVDFDAQAWRGEKPYGAFDHMTAADAFWAAKLVLRFGEPHVRAAVRMGKLTDPRSEDYLVRTIMARARIIGRTYVATQTALDRFRVDGDHLCATDLAVHHRLTKPAVIERLGDDGVVASRAVGADGLVCFPGPGRGYAVYRLRTLTADGERHEPVEVHVSGGERPRVIGVRRDW